MAMNVPWNFNGQQESDQQPLNMALLLLQQELAELSSGGPMNKQMNKDEQHIECVYQKQLEPTVCIKEEPNPLPMNYQYPVMPGNYNMVPPVWQLPQPLHLQRMEQTVSEYTDRSLLNLV
ncbi:hypothetical protein C0J52_13478 [Blattella germanica]|nr:hypothetical protein C0J52_13478 [Blattella germanica]